MNEVEVIERDGTGMGGGGADLIARGATVQQTRSMYATAVTVQRARSLPEVRRRLLEEARLAGEAFYYGWGSGKNKVEGPSVKLAMAAARCWGNCAVDVLPVQDLPDSWIVTASFVDLETGFTLMRQLRASKNSIVHGKADDERKDDIRFQKGQSLAARNVVCNALPASLIDAALEEAKKGVREKVEQFVKDKGLAAAVDMMLRALAKKGVREEQVLAKCGVADRKGVTVDHIVTLRGDLAAIEDGQERAESLFPASPEKPADKPAQPTGPQGATGATAGPQGPIPGVTPPAPAMATADQLGRIELLTRQLDYGAVDLDELYGSYGFGGPGELTATAAASIVAKLEDEQRHVEATKAQDAAKGKGKK